MRTDLPPSNALAKVLQKMQIRIYFWKKMYFCIKKVHFLKIDLPFLPLIPCLIPPTDDRETTERTPTQLPMTKKCFLLRLAFFTGLVCAGRCHSAMGLFRSFPHRLFPLSNHSTAALLLALTLYVPSRKWQKNRYFLAYVLKKLYLCRQNE